MTEGSIPTFKGEIPPLPKVVTRKEFANKYTNVVLGDSGMYNIDQKN